MRAALIVILALVGPGFLPAMAQQVTGADAPVAVVRAGEHGEFTRVTLAFEALPGWQVGRVDEGYEVRLDAPHRFDLDAAFARINRDRVASLVPRPGSGALGVELGCPCHLRPFVADGRMLVLDVYPGPAPAGSPFEVALDNDPISASREVAPMMSDRSEPIPLIPRMGAATAEITAALRRLPAQSQAETRVDGMPLRPDRARTAPQVGGVVGLLAPRPPTLDVLARFAEAFAAGPPDQGDDRGAPLASAAGLQANGSAAATPRPDPIAPLSKATSVAAPADPEEATDQSLARPVDVGLPDPRLLTLQQDLMRGLGEAAARGAIEVAHPDGLPEMRARTREVFARSGTTGLAFPPDLDPAILGQMLTRGNLIEPARDRAADGQPCIPDERLEIASWGEVPALVEDIARYRSDLLGEFDRPDPDAIEGLVRTYLAAGFGAEARQVLRGFAPGLAPGAIPDAPVYEAMAHIVDGDLPPRPNAFDGLEVCDGFAALWAALAMAAIPPAHAADTNAIARGFAALPSHLRSHLGPDLVARMLAAGHDRTAAALRAGLARAAADPAAVPSHEDALTMVDARLDLYEGESVAAEAGLRDVAASASPMAVEAMIALVESRLQRDEPIAHEDLLALSALAREHRGSALGDGLRRAEALATAAAGDFLRAFEALSAPGEPVRSDLWQMLAERGADAFVLELSIPDAARARSEAKEATRLLLADRLIGLGFPEPGLVWLRGLSSEAAQLMAARAHLERGAPAEAIADLTDLDGPSANALRAEALLALGQPAAAARLFADAGLEGSSQRAALQAGDLDGVIRGPDPRLAALAAPLLAGRNMPSAPGTVASSGLMAKVNAAQSRQSSLEVSAPQSPDLVPMDPVGELPEQAEPTPSGPAEPEGQPPASAPLASGRALLEAAARDRGLLLDLLTPRAGPGAGAQGSTAAAP